MLAGVVAAAPAAPYPRRAHPPAQPAANPAANPTANPTADLPAALALQQAGRHREAVALLEPMLRAARRQLGERHTDTVQVAMQLGRCYQALGQLDRVLPLDERVLAQLLAWRGRQHRQTLAAMVNLSTTYFDLGQHARALRLQSEGLRLAERHLGPDAPITVRALTSMATILAGLRRYDEAVAFDRRALVARRRTLPESHPDIESSLNNLSNSLISAGRHAEAVPLAELALQRRRQRLGEAHPATLTATLNLGENYTAVGRHADAIALLQPALDRARPVLGPDHVDTLYIQYTLVAALHEAGRTPEALAVAAEAVQGIEMRRQQTQLGAAERQSLLANLVQDLQLYARLHGQAGAAHWPAGLAIAERSKARTLVETMAEVAAERRAGLPPEARQRLDALEAQAVDLEQRQAARSRPSPPLTIGPAGGPAQADSTPVGITPADIALATRRRDLALQLAGVRRALAQQFPQAVAAPEALADDAATVAARLGPDEVYLSWLLDADGRLQSWLLGPDGQPQFVDGGLHPGLAATVAVYKALLEGHRLPPVWQRADGAFQLAEGTPPPGSRRATGDVAAQVGAYLSRVLLAPLQTQLSPRAHWIVAPDNTLAFLPLEALPLPWAAPPQPGLRVAERHAVSRVQSLAVLQALQARRLARSHDDGRRLLLAMGDAQYQQDAGGAPRRGLQRGWQLAPPALALPGGRRAAGVMDDGAGRVPLSALRWSNLPGTALEVAGVAEVARTLVAAAPQAMAGDAGQVTVLTGAAASESSLAALNASGELARYRWLLFAAHGYLASEPALSSIVLSQRHKSAQHDGYVTAAEWARYHLRSDLVVLSACDTGAGQLLPGEGVLGLPYALAVAGNLNTLLSLWPVDDEATAAFMQGFFGQLAAGRRPAQALAAQRLVFLQHPRWFAPRYWAPFVLYGP